MKKSLTKEEQVEKIQVEEFQALKNFLDEKVSAADARRNAILEKFDKAREQGLWHLDIRVKIKSSYQEPEICFAMDCNAGWIKPMNNWKPIRLMAGPKVGFNGMDYDMILCSLSGVENVCLGYWKDGLEEVK